MVQETTYPYVLATYASRKPGFTREQFRIYNEQIYGPLVKKTFGNAYPLTWIRQYHVDDAELPTGISRILVGADDQEWDCYGVMTFADELHLQQFMAFMHSDEAAPVLEEELKFADPAKTKLIIMRRAVSVKDE